MNKREIAKEMQKACGGAMFITRQQLAGFLGRKKPDSVDRYLVGLERIDKMYYIPDVVENLMKGADYKW